MRQRSSYPKPFKAQVVQECLKPGASVSSVAISHGINEGSNRAAAYVRMSTEHQQYSTENQLDAIRVYAAAHELEIVRVYTDAGKSGLRLDGREALQQLLRDVDAGQSEFSVVLVYDVSRWGPFAGKAGSYRVTLEPGRSQPCWRRGQQTLRTTTVDPAKTAAPWPSTVQPTPAP